MHLDAIRVEAHYSALLAERSNMIVSMFNQIQELQQRVADLVLPAVLDGPTARGNRSPEAD